MKDLLLCVHVAVKTSRLDLEISCCHLVDYAKELYLHACRTCSTIIFPHSTYQIIVFWRRRCRCPRLSSLRSLLRGRSDGENTRSPPTWPWFDSVLDAVRGWSLFLPFSATLYLSPGTPVFPSQQKNQHFNWFDLTWFSLICSFPKKLLLITLRLKSSEDFFLNVSPLVWS